MREYRAIHSFQTGPRKKGGYLVASSVGKKRGTATARVTRYGCWRRRFAYATNHSSLCDTPMQVTKRHYWLAICDQAIYSNSISREYSIVYLLHIDGRGLMQHVAAPTVLAYTPLNPFQGCIVRAANMLPLAIRQIRVFTLGWIGSGTARLRLRIILELMIG